MPNTLIQIKRSSVNSSPMILQAGEPGYSYTSGKLFLGNSISTGVIVIGGQYYTANLDNATNQNIPGTLVYRDSFGDINIRTTTGNLIGTATRANTLTTARNIRLSGNVTGNILFDGSSDISLSTNIAATGVTSGWYGGTGVTPVIRIGNDGRIISASNVAGGGATSFDLRGDTGTETFNSAEILKISGGSSGGISVAITNATDVAGVNVEVSLDSSVFRSTGGTISGDVSIAGNLTILGDRVWANTQSLRIIDPVILLAGNNYTSDIVDIGFVGIYKNTQGQNVQTGLIRDATNKEYYLFQEYTTLIGANNDIDPFGNNFTLSVLNSSIKTSNIILAGMNVQLLIGATFNAANAAPGIANTYTDAVGAVANTNASNATFLSIGTVPPARITGVGTITLGVWQATNIDVDYGGTGTSTFTANGILFGNTTGPIRSTSAGTEGQVLQATATGMPAFGMLDGGGF